MDYRITIDERPGHLFVNVWGRNTTENIARYSNDVREACIRLRQTRVLIIVNLVGESLSMLDVYRTVSAGSDLARDMGMRVAYVDANPERTIDNMILAEDVAATRGIDVRTFRNVADAQTWLLTQDEEAAHRAGVPLDAR
jgi:hypothetical protein